MSDIEIRISTDADKKIREFQADIRKVPALLRKAGNEIATQARTNLATSVDTSGRPFPPLKSGEARRPMMKTLRMFRSFVVDSGKRSLRVTNTAPYSGFQNSLRTFIDAQQSGEIINKSFRPK